MPLEIIETGQDNDIQVDEQVRLTANGIIRIHGRRNRLIIPGMIKCSRLTIQMGAGASIEFGRKCCVEAINVSALRSGHLKIGPHCSFNGAVKMLLHEKASIYIGAGGLIASGATLSISDMHSILDVRSGHRINPAEDVVLGERVWLGEGVTVLKGAQIGADTVVGAGSIVTGDLPPNAVCAGVPARVIRTGTRWVHELL